MKPPVTFPQLERLGRLGNQLWEIASTVGLARAHDAEPLFPASWTYRRWFSMPDSMFGDPSAGTPAPDLATHLDPRCRDYLQDLSLWWDVRDEVRALFAPSPAAELLVAACAARLAQLPQPVMSVHVRRGDNAYDPAVPDKWRYHPLRPLSYYQEAIAQLRRWAGSVAVFTDDPDWCAQHLPEADYIHRGEPRAKEHEAAYWTLTPVDWLDLFLMARCYGGHVVSNSSFAWWGAFLSGDERVILPAPWYGPALDYVDASLMTVPGWTVLEHATPTGAPVGG